MRLLELDLQSLDLLPQPVILGADTAQPHVAVPDLPNTADYRRHRALDLGKQAEGDRFQHPRPGRGGDLSRNQDDVAEDESQKQVAGPLASAEHSIGLGALPGPEPRGAG